MHTTNGISTSAFPQHKALLWMLLQAAQEAGIAVHSWEEFLELGRGAPAEACPPKPADLCTIMYTSGTTGDPKVNPKVMCSLPVRKPADLLPITAGRQHAACHSTGDLEQEPAYHCSRSLPCFAAGAFLALQQEPAWQAHDMKPQQQPRLQLSPSCINRSGR
jgi:hypothetical protein